MSKLVYKSEDGSPIIIKENKEYNFEWTETPPPEGIYKIGRASCRERV